MASEGSAERDGTLLTGATRLVTGGLSVNAKDPLEVTPESAEGDVCQFFLMGKCHFGHRCRFSHSDPSLEEPGHVLPDQDDFKDEEKVEKPKRKSKLNKAKLPKDQEGKEVNKKPRMRTADEVISRILWDPSVEASEFIVGYVDRFLGVLERPFSEFSWDTDPCDCDYSSELALPRHRIQYFSYRGHRVWDRHSRTDRVFGSTGQSLAPPFGGEEEVEKINTDEPQQLECVMLNSGLETTEDQPPPVSGRAESEPEECIQAQNTHLEEESRNNIHSPESTQPAHKYTGNTSQQHQESRGECVLEEAGNRPPEQMPTFQRVTDGEDETLEEWNESWEGNDDLSCVTALHISPPSTINPPPLKQRDEKHGGRPAKLRPTHFITFRANTPGILSCFQQLQEELTSLLPSSAPYWMPASTLHITLCLLVLPGPAEVAAAGEILKRFAHLDRNPPVAVTFPVKLKHFNGKVLWLSPHPQLHVQQLNSGLQEAYRQEGWLHRDSFNPRYHLTLAKDDFFQEHPA
ncbi:leukocyte receptor cluster member 9 isoform X2 [Genypterus blacodes]|uniref:leukocyte receptor cluster member 9 isoform X2 n=1 Tax=Genypterus blacodes TaxID=154954 RepID=UPI003F757933